MVIAKILVHLRDRWRKLAEPGVLEPNSAEGGNSSSVSGTGSGTGSGKERLHSRAHIRGVVAVHIDYANRPESGQEADYVERRV